MGGGDENLSNVEFTLDSISKEGKRIWEDWWIFKFENVMQKDEQVDRIRGIKDVEIICLAFETILLWKLKFFSWYSVQTLNIF